MPQPDPALAIRVSSEQRGDLREPPDGDKPRLRLLVTKGRLGVELDATHGLGPLQVEELALSFPHVRFPVELSGGVSAFRHRRGELERLRLSLTGPALRRWAAPRLCKALGAPLLHHTIAALEDGWLVGVATHEGALAFEVRVSPLDGDLRLMPTAARAVGLAEPPQQLALRALATLTAPFGTASGSAIIVERGPMELARALLPLAGMRAPAARALAWSSVTHDLEGAQFVAEKGGTPIALSPRAVSAVEEAALVAEAERDLCHGKLDEARRGYLAALTRAPRHLEIGRRLAELDRVVGDRAEAALSTLSDVTPPIDAGPLGAMLLAAVGDVDGAQTAWQRAATAEPYGPLAAFCWLELGRMAKGEVGERALDEAIARAPSLTAARWARFENAVRRGRVDEARADVEHLEAQAAGPRERMEVLLRAGRMLVAHQAIGEATQHFERALRYAPANVDAIAGLATALAALGHKRRALELLGRASGIARQKGLRAGRVRLEFAKALAEVADDRPAAIAQLQPIEPMTAACYEARLLDARWRTELGDLAGASVALARLADALETIAPALLADQAQDDRLWSGPEALFPGRPEAKRALATLAEEGARIHELDRADLPAARRLLEVAIRLAPRVPSIRASFKRVNAAPVEEETFVLRREALETAAAQPSAHFDPPPPVRPDGATEQLGDTHDEDAAADALVEARIEVLTQMVRANPDDATAVDELVAALERLGRFHELLALLSARIDESVDEQRAKMIERRRTVLDRMVIDAEREGREADASLYRLMRDQE